MATTNQAQDVVRCMYCQKYAPYHCKTCGVEMCKTCKDSHKKDQNFSNHVIVSYFEREYAADIIIPVFTHRDVKSAVFRYVQNVKCLIYNIKLLIS